MASNSVLRGVEILWPKSFDPGKIVFFPVRNLSLDVPQEPGFQTGDFINDKTKHSPRIFRTPSPAQPANPRWVTGAPLERARAA